jgi:predicted RNase H-like HicB family nuclease
MTFTITLVQDEDRVVVAECPAIPGCVSQGATADEAVRNIREAIRECLAVRQELGLPPTLEVREIDVLI